jgi:catechol 2,3-dioxygenase-like lactoylglutathione lyase family enzyme
MSRGESLLIGRRQALRTTLSVLGAGAWAARRAAGAPDQALRFSALDHVEFFASDAAKSMAFYARVFGNTVLKNNRTPKRYVKLGPCYMAIDQGKDIRFDHFCAGLEGFEIATVHGYLERNGVTYKDYPSGRDLYVSDPDGTRLQLSSDNGWNQLSGPASPEQVAIEGEPIFRPTGLDHILLNVTDPEKSAAFYEKILGPVTRRNNHRTWFDGKKSRIGLLQTPSGQRPGVNHFCVSTAAFDYDAVLKKLEQAGAKIEAPEVAGAPEFRDPDGYLVQVMGPRP